MAQKVTRIHNETQQQQPPHQHQHQHSGRGAHRSRAQSTARPSRQESLTNLRNRIKLGKRPWPAIGAAVAGGVGFTAAAALGAGELALGVAAGYAAYQMFKNRGTIK